MDIEGPHEHAHAPHHTGNRWLDLSLALSAFFISLVSLGLAIHHGHTMDKLVTSNSFPNIDFITSNRDDLKDGRGYRPVMSLQLANTGIGPARLRSLEISYDGKPVADLHSLVALCCNSGAPVASTMDYSRSGDPRGSMIQAGKSIELFQWAQVADDPRWTQLNKVLTKVRIKACYCSVFDDCYLHDSDHREPDPVEACTVPATPYLGE